MKMIIGILLIGIVFAKQKECGRNAHFTDCGPPCPVTCDNRHNPPDCIMVCVSGCHCNEGFVKTSSGRCVKPQHCRKSESPSSAEVCGENERFNGCGTACPLTCENYDNPPQICTLQCVIGCECEKGYVRSADGKCVRSDQCPDKQPKSEEVDCSAFLDPGVCDAFISRFYYDPADESCKEFIYGGCQGNTNNFKTEEECKATCGSALAKSDSAFEEDKTDDIKNMLFLDSTSTVKAFTTEASATEITTETVTTLTE